MDDAKDQLVDKLKAANNVLVTVSRNPSVDQLSALLGLTLTLNKMGKHAAAVFSGEVPSTLEFLEPGETIEKNTDSLRDFIIALDKNKADKLRYKVEDDVVRIFITPYRTSISQSDFDFSQGDFNVDVVVALGVQQQEDLDEAITAHGRILHDATVASVTTAQEGGLGSINWHSSASSLCEMVTELVAALDPETLDEQIATALLTGIVAETDRFRNDKTGAPTMNASAALMAAGANQQLVASKLEEGDDSAAGDGVKLDGGGEPDISGGGTLNITHDEDAAPAAELPAPDETPPADEAESAPIEPAQDTDLSPGSRLVMEPPTMGGTLTANSKQEGLDPVTDPFSLPNSEPPQLIGRDGPPAAIDAPAAEPAPAEPVEPIGSAAQPSTWVAPPSPAPLHPLPNPSPPAEPTQPAEDDPAKQTLTDLEASVKAAEAPAESANLDAARDEVNKAITGAIDPAAPPTEPVAGLNSQPLGTGLHPDDAAPLEEQIPGLSLKLSHDPSQPDHVEPMTAPPAADAPKVNDPTAPPPVPPPIPFQFGNPPKNQ